MTKCYYNFREPFCLILKILTTGFQFFPFSKKIKKIKEAFITKIKNTLSNHIFIPLIVKASIWIIGGEIDNLEKKIKFSKKYKSQNSTTQILFVILRNRFFFNYILENSRAFSNFLNNLNIFLAQQTFKNSGFRQ
jgi:hypothetical protein